MIHKQTVTPQLLDVAQLLCARPELGDFRIVGGTALALHLGHRKSVDIDLFTNSKVNKTYIRTTLVKLFPSSDFILTEESISSRINGVKVDILDDWHMPFLENPVVEGGFRLASLNDIAALKLDAIIERREKKDYVDLYALFEALGPMQVLGRFKEYNPQVSEKSFLFALDQVAAARDNKSIMPEMLIDVTWEEIERSMVTAAKVFLSAQEPPRQRKRRGPRR